MTDISRIIADNIQRIRQRMADAAHRAGRDVNEVTLVAVTKYVGGQELQAVLDAGCADIGESRPQELWVKAEGLRGRDIRWHLIGHLQRNKVRRTLPYLAWLHSGDSLRLLEAVQRIAQEQDRSIRTLLEVNVSGDSAKHGFAPDELKPALERLAQLDRLRIRGLMGMAGWGTEPEEARRQFAALRELRDALRPHCPSQIQLEELSMGMSGDFEQAIEEGATMVRVGSSLFEGLPDD